MQYFGVPRCPYCRKRVNFIRTWRLKRQGEYQCPRCGGISNVYLSPLVYVAALLAVFSGGAIYFFHKFVLDDISLTTVGQVLLPFAAFFLISLFFVYLAKPVIKKVPKAELNKKRRGKASPEDRRAQQGRRETMFYDDQEYLPRTDYQTGTLPRMEDDRDMKVLPESGSAASQEPVRQQEGLRPVQAVSPQKRSEQARQSGTAAPTEARRAFVVDPNAASVPTQQAQPAAPARQTQPAAEPARKERFVIQTPPEPAQQARPAAPARQTQPAAEPARKERFVIQTPPEPQQAQPAVPARQTQPAAEPARKERFVIQTPPEPAPTEQFTLRPAAPVRRMPLPETPAAAEQLVSLPREKTPAAKSNDDFFAKYDDPEYVERRLRELQEKKNGKD